MIFKIYEDKPSLGKAAASQAAAAIRRAIAQRGRARVVAASAASQFEFLAALIAEPGIDWKKIELFHLDEYIGLPMTHPASFCKFLNDRLISKTGITHTHLLDGEKDPSAVISDVSQAISAAPIDVAFLGIGENGHIAFNDPPADFDTEAPYIVVQLDEPCRQQQVGEGWFPDLAHVPTHAISMSVRQALKAKEILAIVPDARKAAAIAACFNCPVTPLAPSSILRTHSNATIYLDHNSAARLTPEALAQFADRNEANA
jgi:glucosamine-6-phosphate deaminase